MRNLELLRSEKWTNLKITNGMMNSSSIHITMGFFFMLWRIRRNLVTHGEVGSNLNIKVRP